MFRAVAAISLLILAACSSSITPTGSQTSFQNASAAVFRQEPETEPVALAPLNPESRRQSELTRLTTAEVARWIFPAYQAPEIVDIDLRQGRLTRLTTIVLYEAPQSAGIAGLCRITAHEVGLRVPDENDLTYEQHLDPPLQPFLHRGTTRWRVVGSTLAQGLPSPADCASAGSFAHWFQASSPVAIVRTVQAVERAQRGLAQPRIYCQQLRYDDSQRDFATPQCRDGLAMLKALTPDLIVRVRPADCEIAPSPRGCTGIEYHDPSAPRTHSLYVVTVPDEERPTYIQITQAMLPPM